MPSARRSRSAALLPETLKFSEPSLTALFLAILKSMTGLEAFVLHYPFWAYAILFAAMFVDGEPVFIVAAILASHGVLSWSWLLVAMGLGVIVGDIAWYGLGYYFRNTKIGFFFRIRFSTYHEWLDKNFMARYPRVVFYSKFLHYINRLTPLIAGWHRMPFTHFVKLHIASAAVWIAAMLAVSLAVIHIGGEGLTRWVMDTLGIALLVFIGAIFAIEFILKRIFSSRIKETLKS